MSYEDQTHNNERLARLAKAKEALIEHFDSVLIICTGGAEDGSGATTMFKDQAGNVHAHEGAVREWLREQESYQNAYFAYQGTLDAKAQHKDR